jgi:hypothetical protein
MSINERTRQEMKDKLILFSSALFGAVLLAHIVDQSHGRVFWTVLLGAVGVFSLGLRAVIHKFTLLGDKQATPHQAIVLAVGSLSLDSARRKAFEIIDDPAKFRTATASVPLPEDGTSLPQTVRELFARYDSIEAVRGDLKLRRDLIGASDYMQGMTRIGQDIESTEVVVRVNDPRLYVIDGSETTLAEAANDSYPSVYHYLLCVAAHLYPEVEMQILSRKEVSP